MVKNGWGWILIGYIGKKKKALWDNVWEIRLRRPTLKNCLQWWVCNLAPVVCNRVESAGTHQRGRNRDRSSDHNDVFYSSELVFETLFLFWSGPVLSSYLSPTAGSSIINLPEFFPNSPIKSTPPLDWGKAVCVVSSQACLDHSFPKFHGVRYKLLENNRINPVQSPSFLLHYGYAGNAPPWLSKWDSTGSYEFPNPYHKVFMLISKVPEVDFEHFHSVCEKLET